MRVISAVLAILLTWTGSALAERVTVTGQVTYRERIALPPNGVLSISLVHLAAPGQPRVSAKGAIATPGQVPLTFTLNFEDSVVLPDHQYGLTASISSGDGTVWFTTAEPFAIDPLAPAPDLMIVLNRAVQAAETPAAPEQPAVVEPAPAETADIAPPPPLPPILDITWEAVSIGGNPVARNVVSSLSIAPDMRAGGKGGCNSWFAQAELNGNRLLFSAVAATRMACLSDAATAQEDAFFAALAATRSWRLEGETLTLLDSGNGALVVLGKSPF